MDIKNINFSHGGRIYEYERKYKKKFIDFSANINPLTIPQNIKNKLLKEFDGISHYPDQTDTIKTISDYFKIKEENILMGNGSCELIYLLFQSLRVRYKSVLIPQPGFSEYEKAALINRYKIKFVSLDEKNNFFLDISKIIKSDMIFLCNPNNPTGNLILNSYNEIKNLPQKFIIIDETFIDFLPDSERKTFIKYSIEDKRIIVIRSFTKFFAIAGLRVGYIIANKDIINLLKNYQVPWNVNSIGLSVINLVLKNKKYREDTLSMIEKERKYLFNEISKIKYLMPYSSVANFLLVKIIKKELTSDIIMKKLLKEGIIIRDCSNFRGLDNHFFRISVLSHKDNKKLINFLHGIFI
jgi:threonine-phosphate decarboxylase